MPGLKNPMPMPAQPDMANSQSGATVADKLTGGQGLAQEAPMAKTVGQVISGGMGPMPEADMKGWEPKPGRSGKVR